MAAADEEFSQTKAGVKSAGVDPAFLGVIVKLPLHIAAGTGARAEAGDNRRRPSRLGQEGHPRKIRCGGEHGASAVQGAAKVRIEEIFLLYFPGNEFVGPGGSAFSRERSRR